MVLIHKQSMSDRGTNSRKSKQGPKIGRSRQQKSGMTSATRATIVKIMEDVALVHTVGQHLYQMKAEPKGRYPIQTFCSLSVDLTNM